MTQMVGRKLEQLFPERPVGRGDVVLERARACAGCPT